MASAPASTSGALSAGTTVIYNRPARLRSIMVTTDGTNAATLDIFDNATTGSGKKLASMKVAGATMFNQFDSGEGVEALNGITAVLSGTGSGAVIHYQAE